jgi:eukaryotic-like serine/threonine-protein kinase
MIDKLGPYELFEPLASGGMAEIFVAKKTGPGGFDKPLVVKRIHKKLLGDREIEAMFVDEARVQALLDHPNVVQIYDFGEDKGSYYIAMEYIDGATLRWVIDNANAVRRPVPLQVALRISADVLLGLHSAHELRDGHGQQLRLIHRDISPVNILVGRTGHAKLCDFGVAKSELQRVMTRAGIVKGKFRYMAPEQLNAEPLDRRADLFSVGCVLWEMVVGRRLFDHADEGDVVDAIRDGAYPAPSDVVGGIPADIDRLLRRACHPNRDKRFRTAVEFARACEHISRTLQNPAGTSDVADYICAELDGMAEASQCGHGRNRSAPRAAHDALSLGFDRLDPPVPTGPTVIRARDDVQRPLDPLGPSGSGSHDATAFQAPDTSQRATSTSTPSGLAKLLAAVVWLPAWVWSWPARAMTAVFWRTPKSSSTSSPVIRVTKV